MLGFDFSYWTGWWWVFLVIMICLLAGVEIDDYS